MQLSPALWVSLTKLTLRRGKQMSYGLGRYVNRVETGGRAREATNGLRG